MSSVLDLVREDLRDFAGYSSARSEKLDGEVWLNANESAWANPADGAASCRRYPDPQPSALRDALAVLYGVRAEQLLIGRGSDEAIDLLMRRPGWCRISPRSGAKRWHGARSWCSCVRP